MYAERHIRVDNKDSGDHMRSGGQTKGALTVLNGILCKLAHTFVDGWSIEHIREIGYDTHSAFSEHCIMRTVKEAAKLQDKLRQSMESVLHSGLHEADERIFYAYFDDVLGDLSEFMTRARHIHAENKHNIVAAFNAEMHEVRDDITKDTKELIAHLAKSPTMSAYLMSCAPDLMHMFK